MPLIDETGIAEDTWIRVDSAEQAPTGVDVIVDSSAFASLANERTNRRIGVSIGPSLEEGLSLLTDCERQPDLISIEFSAMGDGRGFSIARALREAGYTVRLRARGPLIADQFAFVLASGFDEIETTEEILRRQPKRQWLKAKDAFSARYQPDRQGNVLEQRRQWRDALDIHAWAI